MAAERAGDGEVRAAEKKCSDVSCGCASAAVLNCLLRAGGRSLGAAGLVFAQTREPTSAMPGRERTIRARAGARVIARLLGGRLRAGRMTSPAAPSMLRPPARSKRLNMTALAPLGRARKARSMGWCQGGLVAASSAPKQRPAEVSMSTIAMDKPGVSMNLALGAITIYVALLAVALRTGEFELLQLPERLAAGMSAVILLTASVIRILVTLLRPTPKTRVGNVILVVHMISFTICLLLPTV
ncbi:hypothetical protein T492DRAFT_896626 [Pavlovales sp. CCMP2436]|nr:hypothetical protein T492DRAFT_897072 [Pavlovales sp. CCMP2436]KAJ1615900.1 hypothetical protein T492DRAFT_896626 [Pavlovales sp. CCMP2436]